MPATPSKMKMFGSFQRLVSILFRKNGYNQTLLPNQTVTYTADRVIELPAVDVDCALISEAQVADGYQPLAQILTGVTSGVDPTATGVMVVRQNGTQLPGLRFILPTGNGGLAVLDGNVDGYTGDISLGLAFNNLSASFDPLELTDKFIWGDVSDSENPKQATLQQLSDLIVPAPVVSGKYFSWTTGDVKVCEHNFGTKNVIVQIYDYAGNTIYVETVLRNDINNVTLVAVGITDPVGGPWTVLITSGAGFVAG